MSLEIKKRGLGKPRKRTTPIHEELAQILQGIKIPDKKDYLALRLGGEFVKVYMEKITQELKKYSPGDYIDVDAPSGFGVTRKMMEFVGELLEQKGWKVQIIFDSGDRHESGYARLKIS